MTYPILVERFPAGGSLELGCNECDRTWDEVDPEEAIRLAECGGCKFCGSVEIAFRYEEGETCRNCKKLAYGFPQYLNGCCSRVCMLQADYAETLADS